MTSKKVKNKTLWIIVIGLWAGAFLCAGILWVLDQQGVISLSLDQFGSSSGSQNALGKEKAAPDFVLNNYKNEPVRLSEFKDKIVVLNFWATWCAPCVKEMVYFQHAQDLYPDKIVVLAINEKEKPEVVSGFLQDMGFTLEALLDVNGEVSKQYGVLALPNTFFIDREGVFRYHHMGSLTQEQLDVYLVQTGLTP